MNFAIWAIMCTVSVNKGDTLKLMWGLPYGSGWMPQDLINDTSKLIDLVMCKSLQASSHDQNQYWSSINDIPEANLWKIHLYVIQINDDSLLQNQLYRSEWKFSISLKTSSMTLKVVKCNVTHDHYTNKFDQYFKSSICTPRCPFTLQA